VKIIADDNARRRRWGWEFRIERAWLTAHELSRWTYSESLVSAATIIERAKCGVRGLDLIKPIHRAGDGKIRRGLPQGLTDDMLTMEQVEIIRGMKKEHKLTDVEIASRFAVPVRYVFAIKGRRGPGNKLTRFDVGEKKELTIPEIAKRAGVARETIYTRLSRGVRGASLLAGKHKGPRRNQVALAKATMAEFKKIRDTWEVVDGLRVVNSFEFTDDGE